MTYTVPSKGGNASYIVRDTTDYPEKFEPMISEFAQLLTDINNQGIALVEGVNTGAEYFAHLSTLSSSGATGVVPIIFNGAELTISDNTYNNSLIIMTGTGVANQLQITLSASPRSVLATNFRFEALLYSATATNGLSVYGEGDVANEVVSRLGDSVYVSDRYDKITVSLLPSMGTGTLQFFVESDNLKAQ